MNERMDIKNLLFLVIILFVAYHLFMRKEQFGNEKDKKYPNASSKGCSQKSINDAHNFYTFGTPHFVR